ncbi:hypothetical protein BD410DRAFT_789443 [Rickenella mellea]|uniref:F-box domain-containing protein n=1 Tax=Rickenella mellea TaxID=50990 RepID=A0A4Y7Q3I9_9AGAM|nr:hypothetical protein BD410DRAFT_789443 [Rickenella mellea]
MPPSLPTELWKTIFRYATSADAGPHPGITHAKHDAHWFVVFENENLEKMETKFALRRVSHRFRRIALEFLYEFVSIDKPHQGEKLVEMMKEQSSNGEDGPCEWIRFLFVRRSSARIVTEILSLCRSLKGFSWNPHFTQTRPKNWKAAQEEMIQNIPTNLRFLHWNERVPFKTFATFLQKASASLQNISASGVQAHRLHQHPSPSASYPCLTHLHFDDPSLFHWLQAVTWEMEIPSLKELNLSGLHSGVEFPRVFRDAGKSLRVLQLGRHVHLMPPFLSHILDACANLEELYYHTGTGDGYVDDTPLWHSDVAHMKMQKVAIYASMAKHMAVSMLLHYFGPISKTRFPSLNPVIIYDSSSGPLIPNQYSVLMRRVSEDFRSAEISEM